MTKEMVVSIGATVVAIAALTVSIWQSVETRNHNRKSVIPKLHFEQNLTYSTPYIGIELSNNGIGPAIIKRFSVYVDDEEIKESKYGLWFEVGKILKVNEPWVNARFLAADDAIRPGLPIPILAIYQKDQNSQRIGRFIDAMLRLKVRIDYQSVYGDSFSAQTLDLKAIKSR